VCNGTGVCAGTAYTCAAPTICQTSNSCDGLGGCTAVNKAAGAACTADALSCTSDVCNGTGACTHPAAPGSCLIASACYADDSKKPGASCEVCNASTSQIDWSNLPVGTSCDDDGLACTDDTCDASGGCTHPVKSGFCLIDGACFAADAIHPTDKCQACVPSTSQTAWSSAAAGTVCDDDGLSRTSDVCDATGGCTHPVAAATCAIEGTCYAEGDTSLTNACEGCVTSESQIGWSPTPAGTVCRPATGVCDVAETCDGTGVSCPADTLKSATDVCREAVGICDVAETCTGADSACPTDSFKPSSEVCRAAAGECDLADFCSGSSASCSDDLVVTDGTACLGGACWLGTCSASRCRTGRGLANGRCNQH
jgi:hypothetical protein